MSLFDELFNFSGAHDFPIDVIETDDAYLLEMEVPGIKADQIEIGVESDHIKIEINNTVEDEESKFIHRERPSGKYSRRMNFGKPINAQEAKSTMKDGILTITLPYAETAKRVKLLIE